MGSPTWNEMLRSIPWLRAAADLDIDIQAHAESHAPGGLIAAIPDRETLSQVWAIVAGAAEMLGPDANGSLHRINLLGRGDFFFDRRSVWGESLGTEVRAVEWTIVLVVPYAGLHKVVKASAHTRRLMKAASLRMDKRARNLERKGRL